MTAVFQLRAGTELFQLDSSTQSKAYGIRLSNGAHFQGNEKVHHLLHCLTEPRTLDELGNALQCRTGETVAPDKLQQVIEQLRANGLVVAGGDSTIPMAPPKQSRVAYLGLQYRQDLVSARALGPITRVLQILFQPIAASVLLVGVAAIHVWVYYRLGVPFRFDETTISWPLLYGLLIVSVLMHELGHLAACRRFRCSHGPLGFGLYFFSPVFYVDVSNIWRLARRQRAIVDVGGMYLQLLSSFIFWALFLWSQDVTYLVAVSMTDLFILSNLEPFMKLDGYWLLSDLTGIPNLHRRTNEVVGFWWKWLKWRFSRSARPAAESSFGRWNPAVRYAIAAYAGISLLAWPLLVAALIPILIETVAGYPALLRTALCSMARLLRAGDIASLPAQLEVLFLPTIMLLNLALLIKTTIDRRRGK